MSDPSLFLVCGLGDLGQYCVKALKEFGVAVSAIDLAQAPRWSIPELPDLLARLVIGDCRQPEILDQAGVRHCRAVLMVTSDERVNIEAAFAVRLLNPNARLVVRSAKSNLNDLLGKSLGSFAAFEATQLPAPSFALAALGEEVEALFTVGGYQLRVVRAKMTPDHQWCNRRKVWRVHNSPFTPRRVLSHLTQAGQVPTQFFQWNPNTTLRAGHTVIYVDVVGRGMEMETQTASVHPNTNSSANSSQPRWQQTVQFWRDRLQWQRIQQKLIQIWRDSGKNRAQRAAILAALTVIGLQLLGTVLFRITYPAITWQESIYVTAVLLLGGYGDIFGGIIQTEPVPWWLRGFSLILTLSGTAFVGVLYALLTENLLTARFQFLSRRPPAPQTDHIILVGLGRVGQRVGRLLQDLNQPLVGMHTAPVEATVLPQLPLINGDPIVALSKANLTHARSVIVVTDDEVTNLEIGLMARATNPDVNLVIRAFDPQFSENLARILPDARVLCAYALSADAYAAAAFGENILSLFRLHDQTILVMEYEVIEGDTLHGRTLAEVSYGYGVIPVLLHRPREEPELMPDDFKRLRMADRLVVLARIDAIQRIELGLQAKPRWYVRVEKVYLTSGAAFTAANILAQFSGCGLPAARELMEHLPATLDYPLYAHQAIRAVRELKGVATARIMRSAEQVLSV